MGRARTLFLGSVAALTGFAGTLTVEVMMARGTDRLEGYDRSELDGSVGTGDGPALRVAWIGDSLSIGVGASSPDHALSRLVSGRLGRLVELSVLGVSGHRASDAMAHQIPLLPDLRPDWVFVEIGSNDVAHVTSRRRFRAAMERILSSVDALHPQKVVVLGVAEFGVSPLLAQPLRGIAGARGHMLDEDVREAAVRHGALYVPISDLTGTDFGRDPIRYHARDRYHPSDDGFELWARAVIDTLGPLVPS